MTFEVIIVFIQYVKFIIATASRDYIIEEFLA